MGIENKRHACVNGTIELPEFRYILKFICLPILPHAAKPYPQLDC